MSNEELVQRSYFTEDGLHGDAFGGRFEKFNLGGTSLETLVSAGDLPVTLPETHRYSPIHYKAPKKPASLKPDEVIFERVGGRLIARAVQEHKAPNEFNGQAGAKKILSAQEQALLSADALDAPVAVATNGSSSYYIDVRASIDAGTIVPFDETRTLNPGVLATLLEGPQVTPKDPTGLAERVWQLIWHATKAEPKECLLTFVEFFMLKFLSDNLDDSTLPKAFSFYHLSGDAKEFMRNEGMTEVEYYVTRMRPRIKSIFPDNTITADDSIARIFGLETLVSKTSIINGFVFLQNGELSPADFNNVFRSIIKEFDAFGPLNSIDPEFKLRLYETFLRRSARQQRLGQFFTPRNIVSSMVKMAQLKGLRDGAVVLDPAAGVGGFVLEPTMWADSLLGNLKIENGKPKRRIKTIGIDVDSDLHILAKANMLLHFAELVRDPATTPSALNLAMAETFVLMNENLTLGSLASPPADSVDVILTNPPYVTRGSAVYKDTIRAVRGKRNGLDLKSYYDKAGLGLESLFLRYISGALRPGGRAFVIVPQGFLNRTEPGTKQLLLDECNILASIQLPRNAFFNTAQKTYILVLERRHSKVDSRPDILCGIARSTGESLDYLRRPLPDENDLADIAAAFVARDNGEPELTDSLNVCKTVPAAQFTAKSRWDVVRFWSEQELVDLGEKETPVDRVSFIEETSRSLAELLEDLTAAKAELEGLETAPTNTIKLSDETTFVSVKSGSRIRSVDILEHPPLDEDDAVPVYSCFKEDWITKGNVSRTWLGSQTKRTRGKKEVPAYVLEEHDVVTVNANGASVGRVFIRPADCLLTDDVIAVRVAENVNLDLEYLRYALQKAVTSGGFLYEAKLFATRVKELEIEVPVDDSGNLDVEQQKRVASASQRFQDAVTRLAEIGVDAAKSDFI